MLTAGLSQCEMPQYVWEENLMIRFVKRAAFAAALVVPLAANAQVLEVATDASPVGLDPHVATAFSTSLVNGNIYEGLTNVDKDLKVVPAVAESWAISSDGKTYTFKIRKGGTFHNGKPITAADVVYSFERVLKKETGSPYASRFALVKSVSAVGEDVKVELTDPSAPFLSQLIVLAIVPANHGDLQREANGTGPFKLTQWVPDTYLQLAKHDGYWDKGLPKLAGLKINIVPEASTRQVGISTGIYQFMPSIDASTAVALKGNPAVKLLETRDLAYSLVGFNTTIAPFDKPQVREAFNLAVDRAKVVQAAYFGHAVPGGPLSPALTEWAAPVSGFSCYTPDANKAKALLKEAGFSGDVPVTLKVLGSIQTVRDVAQVVQAQLNAAGFKATLEIQEQGKFIQDWRNSNFEAFVSQNGGSPDPDDYFYRTFRTGGSTNVFKYTNPELDKLLDDARTMQDQAKRKAAYTQAQQILACRGPIAHLAYATLFTAVRNNVQGYELIATRSTRYLRETSLAR
jgi:peptide/nickel transport system substrate-binding protein